MFNLIIGCLLGAWSSLILYKLFVPTPAARDNKIIANQDKFAAVRSAQVANLTEQVNEYKKTEARLFSYVSQLKKSSHLKLIHKASFVAFNKSPIHSVVELTNSINGNHFIKLTFNWKRKSEYYMYGLSGGEGFELNCGPNGVREAVITKLHKIFHTPGIEHVQVNIEVYDEKIFHPVNLVEPQIVEVDRYIIMPVTMNPKDITGDSEKLKEYCKKRETQ